MVEDITAAMTAMTAMTAGRAEEADPPEAGSAAVPPAAAVRPAVGSDRQVPVFGRV